MDGWMNLFVIKTGICVCRNNDYIISAYVLQVKVEMELEFQQYEKAKAVREEQLDRLTQICQEQAVCSICLMHLSPTYSPQFIAACNQ